MSDYGSLYLIETSYNSERDATEVVFGYLEQDKTIVGRISSVRVIVNIPGCGENETEAVEAQVIANISTGKNLEIANTELDSYVSILVNNQNSSIYKLPLYAGILILMLLRPIRILITSRRQR